MANILGLNEVRRAIGFAGASPLVRALVGAFAWSLAIGIATSPAPASAQEQRWEGPAKLYTLDVAGWIRHDDEQRPMVARFTRADAPEGPPQLQCLILHRLYWDTTMTRSQANSETRRRTPTSNETHRISNVTEETINGVLVVSYQAEFGNVLARFRIFLTPSPRGEDYNEVSCGGSMPFSEEQLASIDAFLASLRIARR